MSQTIPVLSLHDFLGEPSAQRSFVQQLGEALEHIGFFALSDHGIEPNLIQSAYAAAEQVFALPDQVKTRYKGGSLQGQRGLTRFGQEHARSQGILAYWSRDDRATQSLAKRNSDIPNGDGSAV